MIRRPDVADSLPEGAEVPLDDLLDLVTTLWREAALTYDWNPLRIALRDRRRYRITRFGDFFVLGCPTPEGEASTSLLWGRGSWADLSAAVEGRPMIRADRETAEHALSVGAQHGVAVFAARSFDEYVYDLREQHDLVGKRFGRRRTYLRSLERSAESVELCELDLSAADDVRAVRAVYADWEDSHDDEPSVVDERAALDALLTQGELQQLANAAGLRVDGELVGFGVYDLLDGGAATAHFVKARRSSEAVAGTWQSLFVSAYRRGATSMNGGYDGGLEGLRAAKSGLRPHAMRETLFVLSG